MLAALYNNITVFQSFFENVSKSNMKVYLCLLLFITIWEFVYDCYFLKQYCGFLDVLDSTGCPVTDRGTLSLQKNGQF